MFYVIVILIAILLTSLGNLLFIHPLTLLDVEKTIFSVSFGAIAVIGVDGLTALIIRRLLPNRWFAASRKLYTVSQGEHRFYQQLKIKAWKDLVPELGGFTDFHKDKLQNANDSAYLERFLLESNYGVVIHLANALFGFVIMFIPFCKHPAVWIPVFTVNFVLSLLPVAVLRYNTYTLSRLYQRSLRHTS